MDHRNNVPGPRQKHGFEGVSNVPSSGGDASAAAYFAAAGITNGTEKAAVTEAITDLKSSGIWDKLIYLFLVSPTSLSAALYNAKTAVSGTNAGATHSSNGLATGGSNYFYTQETDLSVIPNYDAHMSFYSSSWSGSSDNSFMGYRAVSPSGNVTWELGLDSSSVVRGRYGLNSFREASISTAGAAGFYLLNMESTVSLNVIHNNTTSSSNNGAVTPIGGISYANNRFPIGNSFIFASNTLGTGVTTTIKSATLGYRLTTQQKTDLYDIITAYNTALGRA